MPNLRAFQSAPASAGTGTPRRWRDNPRNLPLAALALSNLLILALSAHLLLQTRADGDFLAGWWQEAEVTAAIDLSVLLMSLLAGRTLTVLIARAQQREHRAAASEAQLKQAQQIAGLGSFDLNLGSGALHWSDGHYALWGLEPQSVPVTHALFLDAIHPDDVVRVAAQDERLLDHAGPYEREYRVCLRDGSERHLLDQGLVLFDEGGGAPHLIGTVQDITRQKADNRARKAVAEQQEVLRRILEIVLEGGEPGAVMVRALQALFALQRVSPTSTGAVLACVPGSSGLQVRAALAVDAEGVLARARQRSDDCFSAADGRCDTCPAALASVPGGPGTASTAAQIAIDGDGCHWVPIVSGTRMIGLLAVWRPAGTRDPSTGELLVSVATILANYLLRADAEHALLTYQQELEHKVSARTVELQTRERELQEALVSAQSASQTKGRFLANMSHEIRTPLNAILGLARIGRRGGSPESTARLLDRIGEAGEHLLGLVNDILDTSKIEAGKLTLECKPFNLRQKVAGVVRLFSGRAEAKGLALTVEIAAAVPEWVAGDELRLAQVLTNLLSNALKFTAEGSVALSIGSAGDGIDFTVSDSGIGMTGEQVGRLFQPFEQADSSTTRNYGGTGLGLSISQDLAQLMGGEIAVESRPGAGSRFTLHLPLPTVAAPPEPPPAAAANVSSAKAACAAVGRLAGLSILAAEDVEVNRLILEDLLKLEGAKVRFAGNGQAALDLLREAGVASFDAVLMDVQMPVMDGIQATREIVAMAPLLPVIGLTAHTLPDEHTKCLKAGMTDVVTKPVDANALVLALRRQVDAHPSPAGASTLATSSPSTSGERPDPIDWAGLMSRFNGRKAFVAKLVASVLSHHAETPGRLRAAAAGAQREALTFMVHGLKGLSGNLLAPGLKALANAVDGELRSQGPLPLDHIEALARSLESVLAELAHPAILEGTAP